MKKIVLYLLNEKTDSVQRDKVPEFRDYY